MKSDTERIRLFALKILWTSVKIEMDLQGDKAL